MQEVTARKVEALRRRTDIDETRPRRRHGLDCVGVGLRSARVEEHSGERVLGARDRWRPVDSPHVDGLAVERRCQ